MHIIYNNASIDANPKPIKLKTIEQEIMSRGEKYWKQIGKELTTRLAFNDS